MRTSSLVFYGTVCVLFPLTNVMIYLSATTLTSSKLNALWSDRLIITERLVQLLPTPTFGEEERGVVPLVILDDLVWHVPRPLQPRFLGWEDDFMRKWKQTHYSPQQRLHCTVGEPTPYHHPLLCHVPAYIPARLPLSPSSQAIPRVIFISWMTRQLGRSFYTNLLTILHHHPEYELIFFTDEDVDRSICDNFPAMAPYFFGLYAGAARIDIWRMLMIERYGGVYLDVDMSALAHLPIGPHDHVVSGIGGWTHLFPRRGGLLEHWSLAFVAHHPLIQSTLEIIMDNFHHPNNEHIVGKSASQVEDSWVIRFTGPAVYQRALHKLLNQSDCLVDGTSYSPALKKPSAWCNMTKFHAIFGPVRLMELDMNYTITQKLFDNANERHVLSEMVYWQPEMERYDPPGNKTHADVCAPAVLANRTAALEKKWMEKVQKNNP